MISPHRRPASPPRYDDQVILQTAASTTESSFDIFLSRCFAFKKPYFVNPPYLPFMVDRTLLLWILEYGQETNGQTNGDT